MKIVAEAGIPFVSEYFSFYGELILRDGRQISLQDVKDADILLVRSITKVDESLLANSNVKFVGSLTAGFDHIDIEWLKKANIRYAIANGFNALPVADYVVSVLAALDDHYFPHKKSLRAAIVGMGNIGKLVADRLRLLKWDVLTCDPLRANVDSNFSHTDFNAIAECDLISLHVPLIKSGDYATLKMVNRDFLSRQKKGSVLINTSRGDIVDYDDLWQFGQHLHWCFDVWPNEPKLDKKLLLKSLIATPHIAGYSLQSKRRGIDMIYQSAVLQGIFSAHPITLPPLMKLPLQFSATENSWQAIVLGIFNPAIMTSFMRAKLLGSEDIGAAFDAMRAKFNDRYEFSSTKVAKQFVKADEQVLIKTLGIELL